jgi:predicted metal-dependent phosphoesterase TrpH
LKLKIDLHVHTRYSADSLITPEELVFYARKRGLEGVAITDHDTLDGALRIARETDFLIVPGMEITSSNGHIVAFNLQEPIPRGLSADETVDKIHESDGIAVACHPIGFFKGSLGSHVSAKFDAIEVINSSAVPFNFAVRQSERVALHFGKARVAGSDAHYGPEIGWAHTLVEAELDAEGVVRAISKGLCQPFGRAIPLTVRLKKMIALGGRRF